MKKMFFSLLFLLSFSIVIGQEKQGKVNYGQLESMGMGAPVGLDYNAVLLFNQNNALYVTRKDSLEGGHINEMVESKVSEEESFVITRVTNKLGFQYYQTQDSIFARDLGFDYVKDKLPEIAWKITSDTKKIGKFKCLKAIGNLRGRTYTAWFTNKIPLPYGPWKLHGLPGLILEAYDANKEIYFYFKSVNYPLDKNVAISKPVLPNGEQWISSEEFKKKIIESYKSAQMNGRMVSESMDISETNNSKGKRNIGDSYIEAYEINE